MSQMIGIADTPSAPTDPGRKLWVKLTEILGVLLFAGMLVPLAIKVVGQTWTLNAWWAPVPALIFGYLMADFASGTVHWFGDTFYRENTPFLGALLIRTFREHHRDPESICRHGFFEVNGCNCLGLVIPLAIELWAGYGATGVPSLMVRASLFSFILAVFATNQFHKWAHSPSVPALVGWLQTHHLILSADHHGRHHSGRYNRSYCITTGWMNFPLDRTGFFSRTEKAIRFVGELLNPARRARSRRA